MGGILLPFFGSVAARQGQPDPDEIPSLNLWYNSSANTTDLSGTFTNNFSTNVVDGSNISAWKDLSGTGHDANVTGGGGPQPNYATNVCNSLGMVQYTSANGDNLDINPVSWIQNLSGITIYVLARPTSYSSQFPLVSTEDSNGISYDGTNMRVGIGGVVGTTSTFNKDTSNCHIFGMLFDGSLSGNEERLKFRIDGVEQSLSFSGTVGTTTGSGDSYLFFGGENRSGVTLGFMDGYIGEVMIFTRSLNIAERLGVESYLKNKWGVEQGLETTIETFTTIGSTTWTAPSGVSEVDYLVVGGGGGGGNGYDTGGGGGGAGGMVLTGTLSVSSGSSYTVTVGSGGSGGADTRSNISGTSGGDSVFSSITALGGDLGNASRTVQIAVGTGGSVQNSDITASTGGDGGGNGGTAVGGSGGGGGGAGGAGSNGTSGSGGSGGAGISSDISGTLATYGAGGAGARGNFNTTEGSNGTANTGNGGGGGGAASFNSGGGGNGGSGIVIIKYFS